MLLFLKLTWWLWLYNYQTTETPSNEIKEPEVKLNWDYQTYEDKMGRGEVKTATIKSINQIEFDSPYSGLQRASLQLRKHPK